MTSRTLFVAGHRGLVSGAVAAAKSGGINANADYPVAFLLKMPKMLNVEI